MSNYPHDRKCEGEPCWCITRAKKENPDKWAKYLKDLIKNEN